MKQSTQAYPPTLFDTAFERLIGHEGGYQNNRKDRGNWTTGIIGKGENRGTKYGISAMSYPDLDIKNLTLYQAKQIYFNDYWLPLNAATLPDNVQFELFDAAVNHGVSRSVMFLQAAVDVAEDGDCGDITLGACREWTPERLEMKFLGERLYFFTKLKSWDNFSRGWARRIAENLKDF